MFIQNDVIQSFHTHPMSKKALPDELENQFFLSALAQYELDIKPLGYNEETGEFTENISRGVVYTLGLIMYCEYLIRELSRIEKLNGFYGKDIHMTGNDTSKRVTYSDLELELKRVQQLLHKQKTPAYD
jgi:hypothetical protein